MKALFFGSKSLGLAVFKSLYTCDSRLEWHVVHPKDVDDPRSMLDEFNQFTMMNDIGMSVVERQSEGREILCKTQPDIIFVCGWYWLFNASDLETPSLGVWGVHNSLLPKYRGGSPLVWALINGETHAGSSIFKLSNEMDAGPILHQMEVAIHPNADVGDVLDQIETRFISELPQKWTELLSGNAVLVEQDETQATYCGQRLENDGRISWTNPAKKIHDFVRAQAEPYPGSFCFLDKEKLIILKTRIYQKIYYGTPGQVLRRSDVSVVISCGNSTAIEIISIKRDGVTYAAHEVISSARIRLE